MTEKDKQVYVELEMARMDPDIANMDIVTQYMVDFFHDVEKHQGRMLRKVSCSLAKKAVYVILKEYNSLASKYNSLLNKEKKDEEHGTGTPGAAVGD